MEHAPATVARRIVARIIEGAITFTLTAAVLAALRTDVLDSDRPAAIGVLVVLASPAIEMVLLHARGGTLGHLILGMRAVTDDGVTSWSQALVRSAVFAGLPVALVEALGIRHGALTAISVGWGVLLLISVVADREHRGIHDRLAGTTVVRVR